MIKSSWILTQLYRVCTMTTCVAISVILLLNRYSYMMYVDAALSAPSVPDSNKVATTSPDDVFVIKRTDLVSLYGSLLSNYDDRVRPVYDQSQHISVNTLFVPMSIINFDTTKQKVSILFYIRAAWKDELLTWNPKNYSGTNFIKIPTFDIWMPTLRILEEYDGRNYIGESGTDIAKISSDGDVQWVPEGIYSVVCEVNIQYYPYDEQTCTFTYYIPGGDNRTVSLDHVEEVTLDEYIQNAAWKLLDVSRQREVKWGTCFIHITFTLQRRAHFATFTIVTPLLMLGFLNIGVFLVPSSSGEKGTFAITVFLAYGIFITIVSDTLPHNSLQTSYFVVFIISLLAVSAFSVFYAVLQAKLFATIGGKECKIRLPFLVKQNRVEPEKAGDQLNGTNQSQNKHFTWGMLLNKVDIVMGLVFFVAVVCASITFFCVMLTNITQ